MEQKDYYDILGIEKHAKSEQIKDAYRKLAFKYHPDRSKLPDHAEKMKAINEAYAVLSNPDKRREYDALKDQFGASSAYSQFRQNNSEQDIFNGSDIYQIFEEMARSFGFRDANQIFKEFYGPGYRTLKFSGPGFAGTGFVFFGVFGSLGQLLIPGALKKLFTLVSGDLKNRQIPEKGADISDIIYLSEKHADQGGAYAYFHKKRSKKLIVKVPSGIKDGQQIRLAGMGEDSNFGDSSGDLLLKVRIRRPLLDKIKKWIN